MKMKLEPHRTTTGNKREQARKRARAIVAGCGNCYILDGSVAEPLCMEPVASIGEAPVAGNREVDCPWNGWKWSLPSAIGGVQ